MKQAADRQPEATHGVGSQRHPPPGTHVKVYVVMQRMFRTAASSDKPNRRIVAVKLNRAAAQRIVDAIPGTWVEKFFADKA